MLHFLVTVVLVSQGKKMRTRDLNQQSTLDTSNMTVLCSICLFYVWFKRSFISLCYVRA